MRNLLFLSVITITTIFALSDCSNTDDMDKILAMAGSNRQELELVLNHFRNDDLKYNAAQFLIKNMVTKHYYEGWQIDTLKTIKLHGRMSEGQMEKWKQFDYHKDCKRVNHLNVISSTLLIDNIDNACDIWKSRPWHESYSFEDFCEYVLPYCIDNEPLEEWRSIYYNKYSSLVDSILLQTTDVVEVASLIAKTLKAEGFSNHADVALPHLGALYLLKNRVGYCRENCDIATYVMRSLGIPIATDFYITSPSYNSRHFWSAIIDTDGHAIPFNYTEKPIDRNSKYERKLGKAYRNMFGLQKDKFDCEKPRDIPVTFVNPFIKDVSSEYFATNKPLTIYSNIAKQWMFLSIYDGRKFVAIDMAFTKNGTAQFDNLEEDIIVFPTVCVNGTMHPCGYPVLTGINNHHVFNPDLSIRRNLIIKRKYPMMKTMQLISNMIGGVLRASNDSNFNNSIIICEFRDTLKSNSLTIECDLAPVRFLKYTASVDKHIEIGELHVFDKNGDKIPFHNIKADHPLDNAYIHDFSHVSDNVWSSFYMSSKGDSLTFDLGRMVEVKNILFVPRNDDNFVRKGQEYELFYHAGTDGWQSLGYKIAESDSLIYDNVPGNAIFWLRNYTEGKEERCFYEMNGKQIFI